MRDVTTVRAALAEARALLGRAGVGSAGLDARLLLADAAGLDAASLIARDGEELPPLAGRLFRAHMSRRLAGEPVARIVGTKEFWGLPFALNDAVLVPRPDTETLVEVVLAACRQQFGNRIRICDLGTGSGAILIALLRELPDASGVAVDISPAALGMARANAERLGVLSRMSLREGDFGADGFENGPEGPFDVVVSNPPYIRTAAIDGLAPEVRDYDPRLALDGGPDGLSAYRAILRSAPFILKQGGLLAFEVGNDQGGDVGSLCREAGLRNVAVQRDLSGADRVVAGTWGSSETARELSKKALGEVEITG
jgi:release factor glutamine methyltransferase